MKVWSVYITVQAEKDIKDIYDYIAYVLLEPSIAMNQVRRIRAQISKLDQMPERYPIYDRKPWKSRGFHRMNVNNYSVFYVIDESSDTVTVIAVIYAARDIDNVLSERFGEG